MLGDRIPCYTKPDLIRSEGGALPEIKRNRYANTHNYKYGVAIFIFILF